MRISNAQLFYHGRFILGYIDFDTHIKSIHEGSVSEENCTDLDARGAYVIPGLIDIHSHAAVGADASDGNPEGLIKLSRYYAAGGVTSWCPTTMTLPEDQLADAVRSIAGFVRPDDGAKIAGINMEGPFVSYAKRGAQNPAYLRNPDFGLFRQLYDTSGGLIKVITVAPEEPGAIDFIREASRLCTVSVGHTAANYAQAMAAYQAGARLTTHLFNAMPPLHHRESGVIGAAFDAGAYAELIADGLHVHPSVVRMAFELFKNRLVLVSDSLRCSGMPEGTYTLGGQPITMKGGRAVLFGSETLAGSTIHLMDALRRSISFGIPLEAAISAATAVPAKVIGMGDSIGALEPGFAADLVILNQDFEVIDIFIDGVSIQCPR